MRAYTRGPIVGMPQPAKGKHPCATQGIRELSRPSPSRLAAWAWCGIGGPSSRRIDAHRPYSNLCHPLTRRWRAARWLAGHQKHFARHEAHVGHVRRSWKHWADRRCPRCVSVMRPLGMVPCGAASAVVNFVRAMRYNQQIGYTQCHTMGHSILGTRLNWQQVERFFSNFFSSRRRGLCEREWPRCVEEDCLDAGHLPLQHLTKVFHAQVLAHRVAGLDHGHA